MAASAELRAYRRHVVARFASETYFEIPFDAFRRLKTGNDLRRLHEQRHLRADHLHELRNDKPRVVKRRVRLGKVLVSPRQRHEPPAEVHFHLLERDSDQSERRLRLVLVVDLRDPVDLRAGNVDKRSNRPERVAGRVSVRKTPRVGEDPAVEPDRDRVVDREIFPAEKIPDKREQPLARRRPRGIGELEIRVVAALRRQVVIDLNDRPKVPKRLREAPVKPASVRRVYRDAHRVFAYFKVVYAVGRYQPRGLVAKEIPYLVARLSVQKHTRVRAGPSERYRERRRRTYRVAVGTRMRKNAHVFRRRQNIRHALPPLKKILAHGFVTHKILLKKLSGGAEKSLRRAAVNRKTPPQEHFAFLIRQLFSTFSGSPVLSAAAAFLFSEAMTSSMIFDIAAPSSTELSITKFSCGSWRMIILFPSMVRM